MLGGAGVIYYGYIFLYYGPIVDNRVVYDDDCGGGWSGQVSAVRRNRVYPQAV
jgi:hypothetical protein